MKEQPAVSTWPKSNDSANRQDTQGGRPPSSALIELNITYVYPPISKEELTKRIEVVRSWPEERKQKVFADIKAINKRFAEHANCTGVKCSAFVCQVTDAALGFEGGMGDEEAMFILWG